MTPRVRTLIARLGQGAAGIVVLLAIAMASAQPALATPETPAPSGAQQQQPKVQQAPPEPSGINSEFGNPLAEESRRAAEEGKANKGAENDQEKMIEEMKYSPSVRWMAEHLHVSPQIGYWVGILIDFGILALLIIWALKKNLPAAFRSRTASIQRGIEEARKASADANLRLAHIEERLVKLDQEVAAMKAAADQETVAEEERIRAAAEQDKQRIVEAAESEIAAATKLARRDLKAFAADLAVTLAERRIRVDEETDEALVRSFTAQLGNSTGKDGH